jgi:hypothetical protein
LPQSKFGAVLFQRLDRYSAGFRRALVVANPTLCAETDVSKVRRADMWLSILDIRFELKADASRVPQMY